MLYLYEPILLSELLLVNNSKKLKENPELFNDEFLPEIEDLREQYIKLEEQDSTGKQKEKREIRNRLRDLSYKTYINRDPDLFGRMVLRIIDGVIARPQFSQYTFKDEMKSLAIQHIFLYTHKFNPYRQSETTGQYVSAFGYLSTIVFNACMASINKFKETQKKLEQEYYESNKPEKFHNKSTIIPDYDLPTRVIKLVELKEGELKKRMKQVTIKEDTEFYIPEDYKITNDDLDYIKKYEYCISVKRIKNQK